MAPLQRGNGLSARERQARDAAALARQLRLPARGQALAVAAVLSGDVAGPASQRRFLLELRKLDGWSSLPPSLAIHRVLGTPDPFEYEALWQPAQRLLGQVARAPGSIADAVSVGGRAPRRCLSSPASRTGLPLLAARRTRRGCSHPDGSTGPKDKKKKNEQDPKLPSGRATPTAVVVDPEQVTSFEAPCSTPVLALVTGGHGGAHRRRGGGLPAGGSWSPVAATRPAPSTATSRTRRSTTATRWSSGSRWPRWATSAPPTAARSAW